MAFSAVLFAETTEETFWNDIIEVESNYPGSEYLKGIIF